VGTLEIAIWYYGTGAVLAAVLFPFRHRLGASKGERLWFVVPVIFLWPIVVFAGCVSKLHEVLSEHAWYPWRRDPVALMRAVALVTILLIVGIVLLR